MAFVLDNQQLQNDSALLYIASTLVLKLLKEMKNSILIYQILHGIHCIS